MKIMKFMNRTLVRSVLFFGLLQCTPSKPKSSLQIMGFNSDIFVESVLGAESKDTALHFLYHLVDFEGKRITRISRVSKADFDAGKVSSPIEANVGQFGLTAISHTSDFPNTITSANLSIQTKASCRNTASVFNASSEIANCSIPTPKSEIDCQGTLKLLEILNNVQSQMNGCTSIMEIIKVTLIIKSKVTSEPQYSDFPAITLVLKPAVQ